MNALAGPLSVTSYVQAEGSATSAVTVVAPASSRITSVAFRFRSEVAQPPE